MDDGCDKVLTELDYYLDGECDGAASDLIRGHLSDCPPCVDRAEFAKDLKALIASRCREAPPADLLSRVAEALRLRSAT